MQSFQVKFYLNIYLFLMIKQMTEYILFLFPSVDCMIAIKQEKAIKVWSIRPAYQGIYLRENIMSLWNILSDRPSFRILHKNIIYWYLKKSCEVCILKKTARQILETDDPRNIILYL